MLSLLLLFLLVFLDTGDRLSVWKVITTLFNISYFLPSWLDQPPGFWYPTILSLPLRPSIHSSFDFLVFIHSNYHPFIHLSFLFIPRLCWTWSVDVQVHSYLVLPVIVWFISKIPTKALKLIAVTSLIPLSGLFRSYIISLYNLDDPEVTPLLSIYIYI